MRIMRIYEWLRIIFLIIILLLAGFYFGNKTDNQITPKGSGAISSEEFRGFDFSKQSEVIESMAEDDPALAWQFLKTTFVINGQVVGNVHGFAHTIGNLSFDKFGIEGIKICDSQFAFGCFHGVTEAMLIKVGVSKVKEIEDECLRIFPPQISQNYTGCIHGTGHGLYEWETGNLKKALVDCDIISEPYRQYCYDGVFMENSNSRDSRGFDPKNPWKFCSDLDLRYHRNCARYQSQIFLGQFGTIDSTALVGKNCALGPSVLLRETCFESLGYYVAQNSLGRPADILKNCQQMPTEEGVEICILGGATETVFQKYKGFEKSSFELCRYLKEPRQSQCSNNIKNMINQNVQN